MFAHFTHFYAKSDLRQSLANTPSPFETMELGERLIESAITNPDESQSMFVFIFHIQFIFLGPNGSYF